MNESALRELPGGWIWTRLGDIRLDKGKAIVPNTMPDQMFELYSVPAYDLNKPEIVLGKEIGLNKQIVEEETVLLCKINPRINRVWAVGNHSLYLKIASTEWIPFSKIDAIDVSGVGGSLMRIKADTLAQYPFPLPPSPNSAASSQSWKSCSPDSTQAFRS